MEKLSALEKKYIIIEENLKEQATFYMEDVQALFPDMKQASIYWNLSKLVEAGYLKRVRTGVYAFNEWKGKTKIALTDDIKRVQEILDESGFEYFINEYGRQFQAISFLKNKGVEDEVIAALSLLSHDKEKVGYFEYVENIIASGNVTAIHVKLNDLHHNLQRGKVSYEAAVASNDAAKIKELERINAKHERASVSERYRRRNQSLSKLFTSAGFNAQS